MKDFTTLSGEALTSALALDFSALDDEALASEIAARRTAAEAIFALDAPTVAQVNDVTALVASIEEAEAEVTRRDAEAAEAAEKFAAARAQFTANSETEAETDGEAEDGEAEDDEAEEAEEDGDDTAEDSEADTDSEGGEDGGESAAVTASLQRRIKPVSAASKIARKTKRPARDTSPGVTITAAANVTGYAAGQRLETLTDVAKTLMARGRGFPSHDLRSARQISSRTGGKMALNKFEAASFHVDFDPALVASERGSAPGDYSAMQAAVNKHTENVKARMGHNGPAAQTASMGWCSPSEVVYNWVADYVVDGLKSAPELAAPRGGLLMTEGPQLAQGTYADPDSLGFDGTEEDMEPGSDEFIKDYEVIECPEFTDHRLDFTGYCWKFPLLTQSTFPELIEDALKMSDAQFAHKMNRRLINDIVSNSTAISAVGGFGGSVTDSLEALVQVAVKERRWWMIGENAVMEVTVPQWVRDVFKIDMARRSGLALGDVATDQKLNAYFANHNLSVEYVADFQDIHGAGTPSAAWPGSFEAIIYPVGTFAKVVHPVINLSAVYDAASLSVNEYTGVFFEQGYMTVKRGYRSHVVEIPICTAGATGANAFACDFGSI